MSSDINNHILRRQYTAHKGEDLLSQVHRVICIVSPKAFISAGFHPSGEVLVVNSSLLDAQQWNSSFIEYELLNDPLLAAPEMIKSVFIVPVKNILIPNELYTNDAIAHQWLQSTFHYEADEKISVFPFEKSELRIAFSFPKSIENLFEKYTADLKIAPLNMVHFKNSIAVENLLQCTISDSYAIATLHHNKKLCWQQTFEFETPEDIVYKLNSACTHFGIDLLNYPLSLSTTSIEQHAILKKLHQYLPALQNKKAGISDFISPEWSAAIHLFQQLYTCE